MEEPAETGTSYNDHTRAPWRNIGARITLQTRKAATEYRPAEQEAAMRVFWALMAALFLAGGAVLFMRDRPAASGGAKVAETAARPAPEVQDRATSPDASSTRDADIENATPTPQAQQEALAVSAEAPDAEATVVEPPIEVVAEEHAVAEVSEVLVVEVAAPEATNDAVAAADETNTPPEAPSPAVAVTTREDLTPRKPPTGDAAPAEPEVRPDAVERREDGSFLIGGKHVVTGEGTVEKPYEISWEMLISASRVYRPKQGKLELPEWAALLNGKQVRITGFIAFPFVADAASECLLMLNQWDGCCIGVPPTPYDAVEVKLGVPLDLTRQAINYGSIRGAFSVDPYLVNDFLVGLYVMDDGVVEAAAARDAQGY